MHCDYNLQHTVTYKPAVTTVVPLLGSGFQLPLPSQTQLPASNKSSSQELSPSNATLALPLTHLFSLQYRGTDHRESTLSQLLLSGCDCYLHGPHTKRGSLLSRYIRKAVVQLLVQGPLPSNRSTCHIIHCFNMNRYLNYRGLHPVARNINCK
jgi:hypothetical protein